MERLYDGMPDFNDVLDDVRRQLALCQDSRDALKVTPILLFGPSPASARRTRPRSGEAAGHQTWFISISSLTAGWVLSARQAC